MTNFVLFFGLLSAGLCGAAYITSMETRLWSTQNINCSLATPKIEVGDMGYQVKENIGVDLPLDERVWVGYYLVLRVFEYIGCVRLSALFKNYKEQPFIEIKGKPHQCYPDCGDDVIIGVTKTRCYCLGSNWTLTDLSQPYCYDDCISPDVACGGRDGGLNTFLSIYKMNSNVTVTEIPGSKMKNDCLRMDARIPRKYIWDDCYSLLTPMCSYDGNIRYFNEQWSVWTFAANKCFREKAIPTTYSNSRSVDLLNVSDVSALWTGVFKMKVVYRYNAKVAAQRRHDQIRYGYLIRDSYNIKLQFTGADSYNTVLCVKDQKDKSDVTTKTTGSPFSKLDTTSQHSSSAHLANENIPYDGSLAIGIVTGICVFLLSLFMILLLGYLYRRRVLHTASDQAHYITPENMTTAAGNMATASGSQLGDVHDEYVDHYYINPSPAEIIYYNYQVQQQAENRNSEMYQSIEMDGNVEDDHDIKAQTSTGVYESLQDETRDITSTDIYEQLKE